MISFKQKGSFKKTFDYMEQAKEVLHKGILDEYGRAGVEALSAATPRDTGLTAGSWSYEIVRDGGKTRLEWHNSNVSGYCVIAILIQYGHATRTGGYVEGYDYVNPAIKPVVEALQQDLAKEVRGL